MLQLRNTGKNLLLGAFTVTSVIQFVFAELAKDYQQKHYLKEKQ